MAVTLEIPDATEVAEAEAEAAAKAAEEAAAKATEGEGETDDENFDDHAKKVIAAIRGDAKKARNEAAGLKARLKVIEDAQKTAEERANEKALDAELKAHGFRDRAVRAEVKALAAAKFADPEDASAFLTLADYVDDDGEIDTTAITADLDALLERKPHLARADDNKGRRPRPDASQGSGGNGQSASTPADEFAAIITTHLNR